MTLHQFENLPENEKIIYEELESLLYDACSGEIDKEKAVDKIFRLIKDYAKQINEKNKQ
jgi:hypothetical protein